MCPSLAAVVRDPARIAALHATGLLDSPRERAFDRLADLARRALGAPAVLVSLVDAERQFFKSSSGLPEPWASRRETPLSHSFCQHVVASGEALAVEDAREHPALRQNLAIRDLHVIAYLGIPLLTPDGQRVGSFCAIDTKPKVWTPDEIAIMRDLADSVMHEIAVRQMTNGALRQSEEELRRSNVELRLAMRDAAQARRQAEETAVALRESNSRLEKALDVETVGVMFWDVATGRLTDANDTFLTMMGYSRDDIARGELTWQNLTPPEFYETSFAELRNFEATGHIGPYEKEYLRKDGGRLWLLIAGSSLGGACCVEFCVDISGRKQAEAALMSLNATLEQRIRAAVGEREAALTRLAQAQKLTALGELAGGVAHDFNNIAQAITGGASMIGRYAENPERVRHFAEMIAEAGARAGSITRRLLSFARRGDLRPNAVALKPLLESLRDLLAQTLGANLALQVEVEPDLPPVFVDKGQLETALVNLATNARDAIAGAGVIAFAARRSPGPDMGLASGDYVMVTVADTGVGMDAATLDRAMEPFFTTKPHGKGTGLGLPMARGFAEQSGGALQVQSAPGDGATVSIWLPVAQSAPVASKPGEGVVKKDGTRRVLLVDDEDAVREVLKGELEHAGYQVAEASGAAMALAALDAGEQVDLLVSDLSMPGMDGMTLIRAAQERRKRLPTILLTGYVGDAAALAIGSQARGSVCLLRKPITGSELADRVAAILEQPGTS
ncbi:PAS domain S-box-containing protein [Rhodoblastus acidophilus]|uniref:ATP-binding protein n=1 Tax=Rhodoblastus acidophilus TaxID=1074 RepID=UPI0022257B11|nr:ATP-binding protein [Rhodoblastus acidophilus]MCW2285989.1 PAS domain S-box-containing protein [Rhodoblastus acidophilus]MCW2334883.1 PAS domain S-box-containing protein [Rhodoblastus acidophilus]